jgi:hypothetical protein
MPTSYRDGVLILECLGKSDPGSEGRFLSHMFDIMQVDSQYLEIRTKDQFLSMMRSNPFSTVHVTTHGSVAGSNERFVGFWTPNGTVRLKDFEERTLEGRIVVSTACKSGTTAFSQAIIEKLGANYYIAPRSSPNFRSSIYFSHWFYHNTFVLKLSIARAINKYRDGYKNPHDFSLFSLASAKSRDASKKS